MHAAAVKRESLALLLKHFPPDKLKRHLLVKDLRNNDTPLHLVADDHEYLNKILHLLYKTQCSRALGTRNNENQTFLDRASAYPQAFEVALKFLNPTLAQLLESRYVVRTIAMNLGSLQVFLKYFGAIPEKLWVEPDDYAHNTLLHNAVSEPEVLRYLVSLLTPEKLKQLIIIKNRESNTVLHLATSNTESFKILLDSISLNDFKELLKACNSGNNVFLEAMKNAEVLRLIQEKLTPGEFKYWVLHSRKVISDETAMHLAMNNRTSLGVLLKVLSVEELTCCLKKINQHWNTPLHYAAMYLDSEQFAMLLQHLSEIPRFELITILKSVNKVRNTLLDVLFHNSLIRSSGKTLDSILCLCLPEELNEVTARFYLHLSVPYPELLAVLIKHLLVWRTPQELYKIVKQVDNKGYNVLHYIAQFQESLRVFVTALSKEQIQYILATWESKQEFSQAAITDIEILHLLLEQGLIDSFRFTLSSLIPCSGRVGHDCSLHGLNEQLWLTRSVNTQTDGVSVAPVVSNVSFFKERPNGQDEGCQTDCDSKVMHSGGVAKQ